MIPISPTNKFQVSSTVNENLTAQINLFNEIYEVESTVSVYVLSSDLMLSDQNDNALGGDMITLDVENGNTTFQIFSNISSYCTNTSVRPSALSVENLDYNREIKLAVKVTALSHTLQNDPIVIYLDNQRYTSFDLKKELSVNILPNVLQFTGTRTVIDDTIVKNTNISCDYLHNPSQLYFTKDEIEYVTNSSGGFGMLFSLDEKAAIPFQTNLSCKLMNGPDIAEYAEIVETSPKNFTCRPLKSSDSSIDAIFQTADGISATFPIMIWTDFDVSDPTKIIRVEAGNGVIKNDSGAYTFALKDQIDENNFIRIQSVIPLEFEFSEIG